jgi:hypothetical protein
MTDPDDELLQSVEDPSAEEHVDERWLISYADMMTLLFGLFVMLYSMFDQFDVIQDATKRTFGDEPQKTAPPLTETISPAEFEAAKSEVDLLRTKLISLEVDLAREKNKNAELTERPPEVQDEPHPDTARAQELERQLHEMEARLAESQANADRMRNIAEAEARARNVAAASGGGGGAAAPVNASGGGGNGEGKGNGDGNGNGDGLPPYEVTLTLPGGRRVDSKIRFLGTDGMSMTTPPPHVIPGDLFSAKITNKDGEVLNIMVRASGRNGEVGDWLRFDLVSHSERSVLIRWTSGN